MRFINEQTLKTEFSTEYDKKTYGIVVKTHEDTKDRTLGLYIAKLMPTIDISEGAKEWDQRLTKNRIKNKKNKNIGSNSIRLRNYMIVPPTPIPNLSLPKYVKGERLTVDLMDQDIKSLHYLPYGLEDVNMRKEDVTTLFVPAKKERNEELTEKNSYFIKLDSDRGIVAIHLANGNGEDLPYSIVLDQKEEKTITITDSKRTWTLRQEDDEITYVNEAGSSVSMVGDTITRKAKKIIEECEEYSLETDSYKVKAKDMKTEANSHKSSIKSLEENGNTILIDYKKMEQKGNSFKSSFPIASMMGNTLYVEPKIGSKNGIYFSMMGDKDIMTPLKPHIAGDGSATFQNPGVMGKNLAIASEVFNVLLELGISVDMLFGMFGVPPKISPTLPAKFPLMQSMKAKG